VEDDSDSFMVAQVTLKGAGFRTLEAVDRRKALAMMEGMTRRPDLVVLDLHLPEVDGTDALHCIRSDARLAGTKVIVATAYPDMAEEIEDQADQILHKPYRFTQLQESAVSLTALA
jgi:CheY-like chemotaxis protein